MEVQFCYLKSQALLALHWPSGVDKSYRYPLTLKTQIHINVLYAIYSSKKKTAEGVGNEFSFR